MTKVPSADDLLRPDWSALPAPADDGAAAHLEGLTLPSVPLRSSQGQFVDLSQLRERTLLFIYPMTGTPGRPLPRNWDLIPGARGCTPQACAFRDDFSALREAGIRQIFGLSTQSSEEQAEAAARLHLPFALLSDADLVLASELNLPMFESDGITRLKRLTMVIDEACISKVFYPVFSPEGSARDVLGWLEAREASRRVGASTQDG